MRSPFVSANLRVTLIEKGENLSACVLLTKQIGNLTFLSMTTKWGVCVNECKQIIIQTGACNKLDIS